jgi:hypothetical protein
MAVFLNKLLATIDGFLNFTASFYLTNTAINCMLTNRKILLGNSKWNLSAEKTS